MQYGFLNDEAQEQILVEHVKKGNRDAFERLVSPYVKILSDYIALRVRNNADSNDILQETMLSVWQSIPTFEYQSSFKTWVFSIARRRLADFYRKNSRNDTLPLTDFENISAAEDNLRQSIERMDIEQALTNLNASENELVYLVFRVQLSYAEIAKMLDIPVGTVKSRMASIKTKLKTLLSWEG